MRNGVAILVLAASVVPVAAADDLADTNVRFEREVQAARAVCAKAAKAYPPLDQPSAKQRSELDKCDAEQLYYGIGSPANYRQARLCAFAKDDLLVLMMLYANGLGVHRNYPVARKAACDASIALSELEDHLSFLASMQAASARERATIDMCGAYLGGRMQAECEDLDEQRQEQARLHRITDISKSWPSSDKAELQVLQWRLDVYVDSVRAETFDEGSARGTIYADAQKQLRDAFVELLLEAEGQSVPPQTEDRTAQLNVQLNEVWEDLLKTADLDWNYVKLSDIRAGQKQWLAYRDAWEGFLREQPLHIPAYELLNQLTHDRIVALQSLLEERTRTQ